MDVEVPAPTFGDFRRTCGQFFGDDLVDQVDKVVEQDAGLKTISEGFGSIAQRRRVLFSRMTRTIAPVSTLHMIEAKRISKGLADIPGMTGKVNCTKWSSRVFAVLSSREYTQAKSFAEKAKVLVQCIVTGMGFDWLLSRKWIQNIYACFEDLCKSWGCNVNQLFIAVMAVCAGLQIWRSGFNFNSCKTIFLTSIKISVAWFTPWFFTIPINRTIDEVDCAIEEGDSVGTALWRAAVSFPIIGWGLDAIFPYRPLPALSVEKRHDDVFVHNEMFDPVTLTPFEDPVMVQGTIFSRSTITTILSNANQQTHRNPLTNARICRSQVRELPRALTRKFLAYMEARHAIICRVRRDMKSE